MILRQQCHGLRSTIPRSPCPVKQSTASLSNHGSSYCCWQAAPIPSAGGIRWEWVRRSTGANPRRPYHVPQPSRELLKVADSKEIRRENHDGRYTKEEEGCLHTSSDKAKTPRNPPITYPSPASIYSLRVHLSAPQGLRCITLMTSGMGNQKHLLSAWHGDGEDLVLQVPDSLCTISFYH